MQAIDTPFSVYANFQLFRDTLFLRTDQLAGISHINSPDLSGAACDFQLASSEPSPDAHVALHSEVVYALPDTSRQVVLDTAVCDWSNPIVLIPAIVSDDYGYTWSTTATDSVLHITTAGTYWVSYTNGCHYRTDTFLLQGIDLDPVITVDQFVLGTLVPYDTYQWLLNGDIIPGAVNSTYTVTQNGSYQVVVSDGLCTDTSDAYLVNNTGVADWDPAHSIKVYPNPATNLIYVNAPVAVDLVLTSVDGRVLKQAENAAGISVADLAEGIYFLKIEDRKGRLLKVEKCVKETGL